MEEWKEYRLIDVLDALIDYRGKTPKKTAFGVPLITAKIIKNGRIETPSEFISLNDYDSWMVRGFPKVGDVVLTTEAPLGEVAQLDDANIALAQRVVTLRGKSGVLDNTYLKYYFLSNVGHQRLKARETGTTVTGIKQSELREVIVDVPPYEIQVRISNILKSLDDKIEVNRKINENLEQQAQALFKSWFVDFEPFKNGEFVESELGMIPKGWRVGKLGEICNVFTGKKDVKQSQPKGLYPFFSCSPNHTYSNEYIYDGPSIIIAGNGSYTGRTSFYFGKFDLYQRTYACTIKEGFNEKIISFLYYMMKCLFEPVKMGGTRGSSIPYIVMNDIVLQKFALDNSLVEKYSDFAYNVMKQIQQNNQESRRLAELRDTLLPKLMSGELNVFGKPDDQS